MGVRVPLRPLVRIGVAYLLNQIDNDWGTWIGVILGPCWVIQKKEKKEKRERKKREGKKKIHFFLINYIGYIESVF